MILVFCAVVIMQNFISVDTIKAISKSELINKVEELTSETVKEVYYTDYDYDGTKEAFIITEEDEYSQTLWFSGENQVKKMINMMIHINERNGICKVSKNQKLFVAEGSGGGSDSWSYCYYVKNGKVHTVKKSGSGLTHVSGKNFTIYPGEFDFNYMDGQWTGHTWKEYYVKWTGKKFKQYKGKRISQAMFKQYKGAGKYLKKIAKTGYKIETIFKRSNGIININVSRKGEYDITYDNVNFKISGKRVKLRINNKQGTDIVQKSGYGGIYKAVGNMK